MEPHPNPAAPRRRRSGWYYVGIAFIVLVALLIVGGIGGGFYWHHLVTTYTETTPLALPKGDSSPDAREQLEARFAVFQTALMQNAAPAPFRLTEGDLNIFAAQEPSLMGRVYFQVTNHQVLAQYTFPLKILPQLNLKDRFLNGVATFELTFQHGKLEAHAVRIITHGKPIPHWILGRIKQQNLVQQLYQNPDAVQFFDHLQSVEIEDGAIIFRPK